MSTDDMTSDYVYTDETSPKYTMKGDCNDMSKDSTVNTNV